MTRRVLSMVSLVALVVLWGVGCESLFSSYARDNPENCVQNPSACGEGQVCNRTTQVCEASNGGRDGGGDEDAGAPGITITKVTPSRSKGGALVTVKGTGFRATTKVEFNRKEATDVNVLSESELTAIPPVSMGTCGLVPVSVFNLRGQATTRNDLFGYVSSGFGAMPGVAVSGITKPGSTVAGDFDGDKSLDVLSISAVGVTAFWGDGKGGLTRGIAAVNITDQRIALSAGKIDGKDVALLITKMLNGEGRIQLLFFGRPGDNRSPGTGVLENIKKLPIHGILVDLNGDGKTEVVTLDAEKIRFYTWNSNSFIENSFPEFSPICGTPKYLAAGDVSGDGKIDLVVSCGSSIIIFEMDGSGMFDSQRRTAIITTDAKSLVLAQLDGVGPVDVAYTSASLGNAGWIRKDGSTYERNPFPQSVSSDPTPDLIAAADLDCDGTAEVILSSGGSLLSVDATGTKKFETLPNISGTLTGLAVGDLQADGKTDIIATVDNGIDGAQIILVNTGK